MQPDDSHTHVELVSEHGSYRHWEGTLAEFFDVNEFDRTEQVEIRAAMHEYADYAIGGGAAPLMWLRQEVGCGPSEIPGYSHACGYHD